MAMAKTEEQIQNYKITDDDDDNWGSTSSSWSLDDTFTVKRFDKNFDYTQLQLYNPKDCTKNSLFEGTYGGCLVRSSLESDGTFWIDPFITIEKLITLKYTNLLVYMRNVIKYGQIKSYFDLHVEPKNGHLCFIQYTERCISVRQKWKEGRNNHQKADDTVRFSRGYVESYNKTTQLCMIQCLDSGELHRQVDLRHVYPCLTRQERFELPFKAIKCTIVPPTTDSTSQSVSNEDVINDDLSRIFQKIIDTSGLKVNFRLIQPTHDGSCWYTKIETVKYKNDLFKILMDIKHHKQSHMLIDDILNYMDGELHDTLDIEGFIMEKLDPSLMPPSMSITKDLYKYFMGENEETENISSKSYVITGNAKEQLSRGVCLVRMFITEDGTFWIVPKDDRLDQTYNNFYKHLKSIHLNEWKSYIDLGSRPKIGDICLKVTVERLKGSSKKKEKYNRVQIQHVNLKTKQCSVRFIDSGILMQSHYSDLYTLSSMDQNQEFFLLKPKAIQCILGPNLKLTPNETKDFLRLTKGTASYELIECIGEENGIECWHVKIELPNGRDLLDSILSNEKNKSDVSSKKPIEQTKRTKSQRRLSEKVIEVDKPLTRTKSFSCEDILLKCQQAKQVQVQQERQTNIEMMYDPDQCDEKRLFSERKGVGYVRSAFTADGVFWIDPKVPIEYSSKLSDLENYFKKLFEARKLRSYLDLNRTPILNELCVRVALHKGKMSYRRVVIEKIYYENKEMFCNVRLLDNGTCVVTKPKNLYPFYERQKLNYKAIRCVLVEEQGDKYFEETVAKEFRKLSYGFMNFELIRQIQVGRQLCWYAKLFNKDVPDVSARMRSTSSCVQVLDNPTQSIEPEIQTVETTTTSSSEVVRPYLQVICELHELPIEASGTANEDVTGYLSQSSNISFESTTNPACIKAAVHEGLVVQLDETPKPCAGEDCVNELERNLEESSDDEVIIHDTVGNVTSYEVDQESNGTKTDAVGATLLETHGVKVLTDVNCDDTCNWSIREESISELKAFLEMPNEVLSISELDSLAYEIDEKVIITQTFSKENDVQVETTVPESFNFIDFDQSDDKRFHTAREGRCQVRKNFTTNGIFWIRPILESSKQTKYKELVVYLTNYMEKKRPKSYMELKREPKQYEKCILTTKNLAINKTAYFRSYIEPNKNEQKYTVRTFDTGLKWLSITPSELYPYPSDDTIINNLKPVAIRCMLTSNINEHFQDLKWFNTCVNGEPKFQLIDQVKHPDGLTCWYAEITLESNEDLYDAVVGKSVSNYSIKQVKQKNPIYNGRGLVRSKLSEMGYCWIELKMDENLKSKYNALSDKIKKLIVYEKLKTYEQLGLEPRNGDLCFTLTDDTYYHRAYIQGFFEANVIIRLLDTGKFLSTDELSNTYPYNHNGLCGLEYKALKCTITENGCYKFNKTQKEKFKALTTGVKKVAVISEVYSGQEHLQRDVLKNWFVKIETDEGDDLFETLKKYDYKDEVEEPVTPKCMTVQTRNEDASFFDEKRMYDFDQSTDRRLYNLEDGTCLIMSELSEHGVFWIDPQLEKNEHIRFIEYLNALDKHMETKKPKTYAQLDLTPKTGEKCICRFLNKEINSDTYHRAFIESSDSNNGQFKVRLLDIGASFKKDSKNIYPISSCASLFDSLKYRAICCTLIKDKIELDEDLCDEFRDLKHEKKFKFKLIEPRRVNNSIKYWYASIRNDAEEDLWVYLSNLMNNNTYKRVMNFKRVH